MTCQGSGSGSSLHLNDELGSRLSHAIDHSYADEPELDLGVIGEWALRRWIHRGLCQQLTGEPAEPDPIADWGVRNLISCALREEVD